MSRIKYGPSLEVREVKSSDGAWQVSGYASTFGNVDEGGDMVAPGAFAESVRAWTAGKKKIRFLYGHDAMEPIGVPTRLHEDRRGLYGEFKISRTRRGEEVRELLKDGAIDSFSIGYLPTLQTMDGNVRVLREIDLVECSVVSMPMNSLATVSSVKRKSQPTPYEQMRWKLCRAGRLRPRTEQETLAMLLAVHERTARLLGIR